VRTSTSTSDGREEDGEEAEGEEVGGGGGGGEEAEWEEREASEWICDWAASYIASRSNGVCTSKSREGSER
jgi:hypothetical protein